MHEHSELKSAQTLIVLTAVTSAQIGYFLLEVVTYFQRFPKDRAFFKILVTWMSIIEALYFSCRLAACYVVIDRRTNGFSTGHVPASLTIMSLTLTTLIEATAEGFFCWRLYRVTKRTWMRAIAFILWSFSTVAHIVWIGIAAYEGRVRVVGQSQQPLIVQCAFWGTFAEGIFVATCLLYELQFSGDRKIIRNSINSTVSQLVSLAMRTSGILVVFELLVAVVVSVGAQPRFALLTEVEFAAGIYTVLSATVVMYTLNWRTKARSMSQNTAGNTVPTLRAGLSAQSGGDSGASGHGFIRGEVGEGEATTSRSQMRLRGSGNGGAGGGFSMGLQSFLGETMNSARGSGRQHANDEDATASPVGASEGKSRAKTRSGRSSSAAGPSGITVSQTISVSHAEEQVPLEESLGIGRREEGLLCPGRCKARQRVRE
ncbi:hypothetical protein JCM11641_002644 [Rhodosporidiobolus odoratus]